MNFKEEQEMLEKFGCKDIQYDTLINNYYIKFIYNDKKYTIEHILNVYGAETNMWELCVRPSKIFGTLEELLNYIK